MPPGHRFNIAFDDGSSVTMRRRERPQLVFDPITGAPTHLINGVQPPQSKGGQNDQTYSIVVPLKVAA